MIDHALELRAWADNDNDVERAMMMRLAASEIDRLRALHKRRRIRTHNPLGQPSTPDGRKPAT